MNGHLYRTGRGKSKSMDKTKIVKPDLKISSNLIKNNRKSVSNKSNINFIERNKSLSRFSKSVDQTSKKAFSSDKNKSSVNSGKKNIRFKRKYKIRFKLRKCIAKFFSSIFERIFRKVKFVKYLKKKSKSILKSEKLIGSNSNFSTLMQEEESFKLTKKELKYSNDCQISLMNFHRVDDIKFEKIQFEIAEISNIDSFDLDQVTVIEKFLMEDIFKKESATYIPISNSLSSESNNFTKMSEQLIITKSSFSSLKDDSLNSNSILEFSDKNYQPNTTITNKSGNKKQLDLNSKFEKNLTNLYETHQKIIDKYLKSSFNNESQEDHLEAVLIVPSLYEKYGFNLVKLFENQVDKAFVPYFVDSRLIGECLYQLDQRIFSFVFELTPFNRRDISEGYQPFDIISTAEHFSFESGSNNRKKYENFINRYNYLMKSFNEVGYNKEFHPNISAYLIMKYGLYPCLPIDFQINCKDKFQFEILFRILIKNLNNDEKEFMTVLYVCLLLMAFDDQKPIFLHE